MKARFANTNAWPALLAALILIAAFLAAPAPTRADDLYVVNNNNSTILKFTPSGASSVFASTYLSDPIDLALDRQGTLYVANYSGGYISRFTPGGIGSIFATTTFPATLALDSAANLYVSDYVDHTITKFTPGGVGSVFATTGSSYPGDMAFDTAGNLYVAGVFDNTIFKFTPGGVRSVFVTTTLNYPEGLAFDAAGNLYVANSGGNSIMRFTPGGVGSVFATAGLDQPRGLAFDSDGNLYVANQGNNTISQFTPDAVGSLFASGLNNPLYIATQIPEPSTWILLALGMLASLSLRRLKPQARPQGGEPPSRHHRPHPIRIAYLLGAGLSCVLPALSASATEFQVGLSGTLYYTAGVRWDSAVHVGTPFSMSLNYSTPPPEAYPFPGYTTYVYPSQSAAMSFQVGPYLFSAGDIQLTVWNNSSDDGYLLATYAGSSPGFGRVEFNAVLQSSNTGLLGSTELPIQQFPVATFDSQALTAVTVEFDGYPGEWNYLGGSITSFSVTEVPEPSAAPLMVAGLSGLIWAFSKSR